MGWRFRKSIRIAPGVRVNIGKRGVTSMSVGRRGARLNVGKRGVTETVGLPGSGLSYSRKLAKGGCGGCGVLAIGAWALFGLALVGTIRHAATRRAE